MANKKIIYNIGFNVDNTNLKTMTKYYYSAVDTGIYGGHYFGYKNNLFVRWDVDRWFE